MDQEPELLQLLLLQMPQALQQVRQRRCAGRAEAQGELGGLVGGHQDAHDGLHGQEQGASNVHHEVGVRDEASSTSRSAK